MMEMRLNQCVVRSWRESDAESIVRHANNRKVWRNLRDAFPHPYRLEHAGQFIEMAMARDPETFFCIAVDDQAVGSIGFSFLSDVNRFTAEIGYFLGEEFWGRGIMTEALTAVTKYAMETHDLNRLFAMPYEWNPASLRVLEKSGYTLEGRLRRAACKDGQVIDQLLYAVTREDCQKS
jgi:ribosomal-protein-alanine N-acetyltransferase